MLIMDNSFDKHIKKSLENLGDHTDEGSWGSLYQKMMLDPDLSVKTPESAFDQDIREKLGAVEAQYNPTHWDAMASQLDDIQIENAVEDLEFDSKVYDSISNLQVPYNYSHWTLMSHRLDEEFSLRRKLYKYKVAEVALMLLALFTLFQYLPLHKNHQANQPKIEKAIPTTPNSLAAVGSITESSNSDQAANEVVDIVTSTSKAVAAVATLDQINSEEPLTQKNQTTLAANHSEVNLSKITKTASVVPLSIAKKSVVDNSVKSVANAEFYKKTDQELFVKDQVVAAASNDQKTNSTIVEASLNEASPSLMTTNSIGQLPLASLSMNIPEVDFESVQDWCQMCNSKKTVNVRVGMFFSSDFNEIITPEKTIDIIRDITQPIYQQVTNGYGGGISLGFQHQKWEVETGITYARIAYEPIQTIYTTGSFIRQDIQEEVFDAAFLNMLKIPLHLNYTFNHIGKWHFYAVGGASLNVLALNHFNVTTTSLGSEPPTTADLRKYSESSSYDGLFEGGNFQTNSYLTANVGMGIERYLNAQWSIFMQPIYQRLIFQKGFGPNNDRFNTLSIQVGAKSTFR